MEVFKMATVFVPELKCSRHKDQIISKGCCSMSCSKASLVCNQCIAEDMHSDHSASVVDFAVFLDNFSQTLEKETGTVKTQLQKFVSERSEVFEWVNNGVKHLEKIRNNIEDQKLKIAQDVTNFFEALQLECQNTKGFLFKKLDDFHSNYNETFQRTALLFKETFALAVNHFYANPSNMAFKLAQQGTEANQVKQTQINWSFQYIARLKVRAIQPKNQDQFDSMVSSLVAMAENAPSYESNNEIQACGEFIRNTFVKMLKIKSDGSEPKQAMQLPNQPPPPQRPLNRSVELKITQQYAISRNGTTVQCSAKDPILGSGESVYLKPFKKYELDFFAESLVALSSTQFVIANKEGKLCSFDLSMKRIQNYENTESPISWMEKLENKEAVAFIAASIDGILSVWLQLEQGQLALVKRYNVSSGSAIQGQGTGAQAGVDMQDGGGFVFVANDGRIGYKNPFTNEDSYVSLKGFKFLVAYDSESDRETSKSDFIEER